MINYYFIGYYERFRGYKFYYPMTESVFELGNARFVEDIEFAGKIQLGTLSFKTNMLIFL